MSKTGSKGALFSLILSCIVFISVSASSYNQIGRLAAALAEEAPPTIIIDPGHGGEDGGSQTSNGILEKDINLSIGLYLRTLFQSAGYSVIMTRETDCSIGDPSLDTVRERKTSDMHNRLNLVEEQKNCILISIHQNHFSQSQYHGTQVFYGKKSSKSQEIAEAIQTRTVSLLQPENTRQCKEATDSIFLLWNTTVPSVLVECGFLSNPEEAQSLADDGYQKQIAFCIYEGVCDYLWDREK